MEIKELKQNLERDLKSLGYVLYDVTYEKKNKILHVTIDKQMDLNEVEELSRKVSSIMDLYDEDMEEYLLDVSSVGIEREIRNADELKQAVSSYIYVKTKELKVYGDLKEFDGETLTLVTKEKNINKTLKINYKDIKFVRYAYKF